jgi:heterodisulfide reductase subunit A-like polyferredoxin
MARAAPAARRAAAAAAALAVLAVLAAAPRPSAAAGGPALVIGAGVAGLKAAVDLAAEGFQVGAGQAAHRHGRPPG